MHFLVADTQLYKRLCPSVGRSVGRSVEVIESKSGETRISATAHPSKTGGRVSGLVLPVVVLIHTLPSSRFLIPSIFCPQFMEQIFVLPNQSNTLIELYLQKNSFNNFDIVLCLDCRFISILCCVCIVISIE